MFAEELGGNTNRRKQEEQRRRRRQLKQQQQRKQKQANAENLNQEQAGPATTTEKKETKVVSAEVNCGTEISSSPAETSKKPSAVSNALILRAERQTAQKQQNSARSIQAFYRSHRSNCISLKSESDALEGYLRDLLKLKVVLKERTDTEDYIPPPVTATALTQKLLYTTTTFPYKHRDKVVKLRDGKGSTESLQKLLEIVILPGIRTKDESLNPFLIWMQTLRGQLRMQNLIRLCLYVMTKESPYDKKSLEMCSDFILSITLSSNNRNIHPSILKACRSILLPPSSPKITPLLPKGDKAKKSLFFIRIGSSLDLISALRYLLLFNTGGSPIPLKSEDLRRDCVSANEREKSTFFFQTVVEAIQKSQDDFERESLLIRLVSEILTVPLLTWRVSTESLLLRDHIRHKLLVVSMIESYTKMFARTLTAGEIESIMPADISLTVCNATPTQCLLANMVEIGSSSKSLNGSDTSRIDFQSATIFYKFVALLVDAVPLGTLTTRDSVVEWFSEKGHEKAIRLSPCVMEQCRRILSSGLVRVLFHCAIDEDILKTKEILARKNERDLKHEKEFQDSGANASAVSLAAKEVTERRKSIFSSSWARKLTDGMSKVFSVDGGQTAAATAERKSRMVQISNTSTWKDKTAGSSLQSDRTVYSLDLLMVLCRLYGIVLARWGGLGGEDAVSRVQINIQGKRQKTLGTKKADACSQTLLSVLSFGTPVLQTAWALLQDKKLASSINVVIHPYKDKAQVRCFSIRPCYTGGKEEPTKKNAAALLYVFISALSHTLIVTDDTELHDLGSPLPLHQLRRVIETLKQLLYRACCVDDVESTSNLKRESNYFGLALINSSSRTMRDLYNRSSRRPYSTPKLWVVDDLMKTEIRRAKTEQDFSNLLSTPLLRICPFLVSFKRRLKLFDRIVYTSRVTIQGENSTNPFNSNPLKPGIPVRITRGRILEDGLITMNKNFNMRNRISVQYYNEVGMRETGIDAGGLFKEFWTDLSAIAFDPNYALFQLTEENCMYPSPSSSTVHGLDHIILFEFLGRILGKALYEGITISPQFSHFFLSFLRGDYNYFNMLSDLSTIDKQLYNNILFLKTYEDDAEDLCLTFTITNGDFGRNRELPLIPNGQNVSVTNENKQRYIGLVAKHYIVDRQKEQSEAFTRGLWEVISPSWLKIFNEPELQILISGASDGLIDASDLRSNCRYAGGFTGIDPTINRFWKVFASFSPKQRADLLRFVTSCERPPPLGFASLTPPFTIQRVGILHDYDRLPTASTCFNILKIKTYSSQKELREHLLMAINSGAGFELA